MYNREPQSVSMIENWKPITYITDVNSMYIFEMYGKKYVFFGDQHDAKSAGGCEQKHKFKCDDYEYDFKTQKYYGSECTSIGVLLHNWFTYNNDHHIPTDFYLEINYTKTNDRSELGNFQKTITKLQNNPGTLSRLNNMDKETKQAMIEGFEEVSWMGLTRSLMRDCFTREKSNCPYYPYVHAHYADVRAVDYEYATVEADPFILFDLETHIDEYVPKNIDEVISIKNQLLIILSLIVHEYKLLLHMMIGYDDFDKYMKHFYKLAAGLGKGLGEMYIRKFRSMERIAVIRNGKRMHRTAAELQRLEKAEPHIAELLKVFIEENAEMYVGELMVALGELSEAYDDLDDMEGKNVTKGVVLRTFNELKGVFKNFVYRLVPMSALSMDAYLLARMFLQKDSQEIVVYAGAKHIEHYANFFQYFMGVEPVVSVVTEDNNRCMAVPVLAEYLPANMYRTYGVKKNYNIKY